MAADEPAANQSCTAVVVVHGLREKRALETLDDFVRSALRPDDGQRGYYPRPAVITASYEARRYGTAQRDSEPGHAEFYEYHWPFLMTADKYAGAMATTLRLLLRRPSNVPDPLLGIWRGVWTVLLAIVLAIPALFAAGYALNTDVPVWIIGLITSAVILVFWFGLYRMIAKALVNSTTTPLVDVARYLDTSASSYSARRAVRGGLVDLLHDLHYGRYSRIVVVAHGVGTYIAYDALIAFWAKTYAGPQPPAQENHCRITDFVTIGAPMSLADLMITRPSLFSGLKKSDDTLRRDLFDGLVRRGALVRCEPQAEARGVQAPFAVTRWTNLWFPVARGSLRGDWFAGPLRPLFGPGIRDIEVLGNEPERLKRGSAHNAYFSHPDKGDEDDVAGHLRATLSLTAQEHGGVCCDPSPLSVD